jgi:hypothetical protein
MVAVDAAKPHRRSKPAMLATGIVTLAALALLAGCDGVTVDLGSDTQGGKLTGNDTPIVEEITWIDMSAEELIANYQQYVGKEVFVRKTVVVAKSSPYVMVGGGAIKVEIDDADFLRYLAVTDTVEARGIVSGLDENGAIIIENGHINVQFSCSPRLYNGNNIGDPVTTGSNGLDGYGVGQGNE